MTETKGCQAWRLNKNTTSTQQKLNINTTKNLHMDAKRLDYSTKNLQNLNINIQWGACM